VDTTKKRLENLGYFSKVETYPEDTDVPGRKDLTILVQEKRTGSLSLGGGFSTVDQMVGTVELTQGNFDLLNWPAFTGGGQKFRLRLSYGSVSKNFLLNLTEPYFLDRRLSLGGSLFYSEADYLSTVYDQRNYGFSIELRKPLTSFMYASLIYQLQNVEIYNVPITAPSTILEQQGTFTESKVTTSLVFDRRDNPLLTRSGQLITLTPYIAGGFLGGDTQIYGWDLQGSQYFPLKWGTILLINGEIATVDTWGNGSFVPLYERLYLGGANDLRGFPYREVGPQQDGQPIGGQSMARLTVEWTFPIIEQARGAFFYDSGFVNSNSWSFGIPALANDVGFGIRLNLPIGPMRLDYGYPLKRDGYHGGGHFNFSVGYQF
jgi:outer membrane protein insertion porin family